MKSLKKVLVLVMSLAFVASLVMGCTVSTTDSPTAGTVDEAADTASGSAATGGAIVQEGVEAKEESATVADYVSECSALSDMEAYNYFCSLADKGLTDDEIIQFFIDLPISTANEQVYQLFQDEGFQASMDTYPIGETYDGYTWANGDGTSIVGGYSGNNLKLPFTGYIDSVDTDVTYNLGIVFHGFSHPWLINWADSAKWELDKYPNVTYTILDGEFDDSKMGEQIDTLIAQQVDGIVVWPQTEAGTTAAVQRIIDAGIPVVTTDRLTGAQDVNAIVAGNFPANGAQCGMYLVYQLAQDNDEAAVAGNLVMLRKPLGSTADAVRTGYFLKVLSYFPGINVLASYHDEDSREQAYTNAQTALAAFDNIDAFYGTGDHETLAAVEACKDGNRMTRSNGLKMHFIGIDDSKEILTEVKEGLVDSDTPYTPLIADIGVRVLLNILEGKDFGTKYIITPNIPIVTTNGDVVFGLHTQTPDQWYAYTFGPEM